MAQLEVKKLVILGEVTHLDAATWMLIQAIREAYPRQEIRYFADPTDSRSQTSSMVPSDEAIGHLNGLKGKAPKALVHGFQQNQNAWQLRTGSPDRDVGRRPTCISRILPRDNKTKSHTIH
jgi:hypothetical protein